MKKLAFLLIFWMTPLFAADPARQARNRFQRALQSYKTTMHYLSPAVGNYAWFESCERTQGADDSCKHLAKWHDLWVKKATFTAGDPDSEHAFARFLHAKADAHSIVDAAHELQEAQQAKQ